MRMWSVMRWLPEGPCHFYSHFIGPSKSPGHTSLEQAKSILYGTRMNRTTEATAMSPVAKNWAACFMGIIFMDSLQHLNALGAIYSLILQVGNGGQKWRTKNGAEPDSGWVLSRSGTSKCLLWSALPDSGSL